MTIPLILPMSRLKL